MVELKPALEFREPVLEDAAWAAPILSASDSMACEYSFTTIFMWRKYYHNRIARYGQYLFVKSSEEGHSYLLPQGGDLKEGISILRAYVHGQGHPLVLFGEDEQMKRRLQSLFPGEFIFEPSPEDFDYLYLTADLAGLAGKKYHAKRNHISAFSAKYDWSYERICERNLSEVEEMAREWCRQRGNCEDKGLRSENCAIREALRHRDVLSLRGGLIRAEGKVVAFTFGSPINDNVFDIHVEKALADYAGAYAVINREFAARELSHYRYINRENDLGLEGLRRAKRSYHPAILLEKFVCREKG